MIIMRPVALLAFTAAVSIISALDVNVINAPYNAVGDGSSNDRPAIQQAIDDVNAAGGGTVTAETARAFGRDLARAMRVFLEGLEEG